MSVTLSPFRPRARTSRLGVLVVDDEEAVRAVATAGLARGGFRVWSASSGRDAVEVFRRDGTSIDLVLLDAEMAGFDGLETLAALRELNPDLRCCLMSASPDVFPEEKLRQLDVEEVFCKPFGLQDLATALREITRVDR